MADTWRATSQAVAFASGKSMLDVFNATGTAKVIKIRRAFHFNSGTGAVTAALTTMRLYRTTAASAGSAVTPVKHDTSNAALDSNTTCGTGRTITDSDLFRQYVWLIEEPTTTGVTQANWETLIPYGEIWNAGYGDSTVQPVTCRSAEGFHIKQQGSSAISTNDFEIEFTSE